MAGGTTPLSGMFNQPAPTLGERRASAIKSALAGFARNVALTPEQREVLVRREAEETPLSANQRAMAKFVLQDFFADQIPGAQPEDTLRLATMATDRFTQGDFSLMMKVVEEGNRKAAAESRRGRGGGITSERRSVLERANAIAARNATGEVGELSQLTTPERRKEYQQSLLSHKHTALITGHRQQFGGFPTEGDMIGYMGEVDFDPTLYAMIVGRAAGQGAGVAATPSPAAPAPAAPVKPKTPGLSFGR